MTPQPNVFPDPGALAESAANRIAGAAASSVSQRDRFAVGLAGGSTPRQLYRTLAEEPWRSRIPWERTHVYWSDERCVPPDDPQSNYAMAQETLLSAVELPPDSIHRIQGELPQDEAVAAYADELFDSFTDFPPRLDVVLLGLGADGHTASLFPDSPQLAERERLVVPTRSPEPPHERISLSLRTLNAARCVIFLVTGEEKADALRRVLERRDGSLPAARIQPIDGEVCWLVDREAAGELSI